MSDPSQPLSRPARTRLLLIRVGIVAFVLLAIAMGYGLATHPPPPEDLPPAASR
jgi:hypothetical protein